MTVYLIIMLILSDVTCSDLIVIFHTIAHHNAIYIAHTHVLLINKCMLFTRSIITIHCYSQCCCLHVLCWIAVDAS